LELDARTESEPGTTTRMKMKIVIRSFFPGVIALIIATVLFCLPGKEFPQEDWFSTIFLDKWIHVGLFAVLVTLWCLPFIPKERGEQTTMDIFKRVTVIFICYGVAIEFVQGQFIAFRTFGIDDMIADAIGCGLGFIFCRWQLRKFQNG
jgi:hypothetical protein